MRAVGPLADLGALPRHLTRRLSLTSPPIALPLGAAVWSLATTPSGAVPYPNPQPERVGRDPAGRSTGTLFQWGRGREVSREVLRRVTASRGWPPLPPVRRPPSAVRPGAALRPARRRIGRTHVSGQPPGPGGAKAEGQEEVPDTPTPKGRKRPWWSVDWNFVPVGEGREASRWSFAASPTRGDGPGSGEAALAWLVAQPVPLLVDRAGRGAGAGEWRVRAVYPLSGLDLPRRPSALPLPSSRPSRLASPSGPQRPTRFGAASAAPPSRAASRAKGERQGQDEAPVERGVGQGVCRASRTACRPALPLLGLP